MLFLDWVKSFLSKMPQDLITDRVKTLSRKIMNAFEMGRTDVDYSAIYIMNDGPGSTKMLTVSWGLTEFGNLKRFISTYINAKGKFANEFQPYLSKIGVSTLSGNSAFISLLKKAGKEDQLYRDIMDDMYYQIYFNPAMDFFKNEGFTLPLSFVVILDSILNSGSILASLRAKFPEKTPKNGGNEKEWIKQYCQVRRDWLANHSKVILHAVAIRPKTYLKEIERDNWGLTILPINCNSILVS